MEDYKKKYEEALERARKINSGEGVAAPSDYTICETIFPELKESEDEKIRKELIDFIKSRLAGFLQCEKFIAWLEKQGEQKPTCLLDNSKSNVKFPFKAKVKSTGTIVTIYDGQLGPDGKKWIKYQSDFEDGYKIYKPNDLELVCEIEQKPVYKVEPKFKIGDWIIHNKNIELANSLMLVAGKHNNEYLCKQIDGQCSYNIEFIDKDYHLWTIQDAKDGDVLAAHDCLVLFKEIDGVNIKCYCTYHFMNNQMFHVDTLQNKNAFSPSTKEQRELLFSKMKEAGYEWDAEKKELKKIEQKYVHIDYISGIREELLSIEDNIENINGLTESQWVAIRAAHRLLGEYMVKEQKPSWSEEDEIMLNNVVSTLEPLSQTTHSGYAINSMINWLKSLKERIKGE